jgi:hypothetical protein
VSLRVSCWRCVGIARKILCVHVMLDRSQLDVDVRKRIGGVAQRTVNTEVKHS